jgi:hypothetical protein
MGHRIDERLWLAESKPIHPLDEPSPSSFLPSRRLLMSCRDFRVEMYNRRDFFFSRPQRNVHQLERKNKTGRIRSYSKMITSLFFFSFTGVCHFGSQPRHFVITIFFLGGKSFDCVNNWHFSCVKLDKWDVHIKRCEFDRVPCISLLRKKLEKLTTVLYSSELCLFFYYLPFSFRFFF